MRLTARGLAAKGVVASLSLAGALLMAAWPVAAAAQLPHFNRDGNILIADQFNNRVIELDPVTLRIAWRFGTGSATAGPHSVVAPNDARRYGVDTLICGTGAPPGAEASAPSGAPDNRVILVSPNGVIKWQYGTAGVTGAGPNQLSAPVCAALLPNSDVLITDQGNQRVIQVSREHEIIWQYGTTGVGGVGANLLNSPNSAELLENGHILIADEGNNRVIEVNRRGDILWQYGDPNDTSILNAVAYASRLADGNTLLSDGGNNRILEVNPSGTVVFSFDTTARPGSVASPLPSRAIRLFSGDTLISDQFNHQVVRIDPHGNLVMTFGVIGVPGKDATHLNAPYDAKIIGDFTGQTMVP